MNEKKGKVIIIVAPSGTGKSTLLKMIFEDFPDLLWSVSTTTRPKRPGEIEGKDYFYVSKDHFEKMIKHNEFVEWAKVHGNYYGTSRSYLSKAINDGKLIVCDLDVQGTDAMIQNFPDHTKAIFIEPPSIDTLRERLRKRATDNTGVINTRLNNAKSELLRKHDFHYLVRNDDLDSAYKILKSIFCEIMEK